MVTSSQILKYFSYEHFYVVYCKFWELDTDHDFHIDRNDLAHYGQCALSYQIIDRIFEQVRLSRQHGSRGHKCARMWTECSPCGDCS